MVFGAPRTSTTRSGRRSARLRPRSAARRETLRKWVRQAERDQGRRAGRRRARSASGSRSWSARTASCARPTRSCARPSAYFAQAELDRRSQVMMAFIDEHRERLRGRADLHAVCRSPRRRTTRTRAPRPIRHGVPARRSAMTMLLPEIRRVLRRELRRSTACARSGGSSAARASRVARCTVERLMRRLGLRGVDARQGRSHHRSRDAAAPCPRIGSSASSRPSVRTSCGSRTSPTSRPGAASSTSPSSSMCSPGASSAGA